MVRRRRAQPARTALLLALLASAALTAGCAGPGTDPTAGDDDFVLPKRPAMSQLVQRAALPPCPAATGDPRPVPGGLPDMELPCVGEGPPVRLSAVRGTPMLVNVWAGWCTNCVREMPLLSDLHQQADGRLHVLGLGILDGRAELLGAAAQWGVRFPSVYDESGDSRPALRLVGPPTTYFVDASGRIVHRELGEITSAAELRQLTATHLKVQL